MVPSRPLTHDLFKDLASKLEIEVTEIIIHKLVEGIFHSKLVCIQNDKTIEVDARTSDAIAIGVRFDCPIYTYEHILSSAGILLDKESIEDNEILTETIEEDAKQTIETISITELENQLNQAIDGEDYELASKIRDEIKRRKA